MTEQEIRSARLPEMGERAAVCLMDQEIPGTKVNCHVLPEGECLRFAPDKAFVRILFLCSGQAEMESDGISNLFTERGLFIGKADKELVVRAKANAQVLELCRWLEPEEYEQVVSGGELPYYLNYAQAPQYTEDCKSAKTISRMLVPQRLIPRFAMGSVETYGKDRVEQHCHPMLEQYFFALEENNCIALIDDLCYPFGANTLLHIPLGSNHGISLDDEHSCHYLWMDVLIDEEAALRYLDQAHMNEE